MATKTSTPNGLATETTMEDLTDQISKLKTDLADLTSTLSDYGNTKTVEAKRAARARAEDLRDAGQQRLSEAQSQAQDFVRQQPAAAIGIAAGVGFLFGMITAGRR